MTDVYDVVIIGAGVAGVFASLRAAEKYKEKVLVIELGRPMAKRRRQLEAWMGCFPFSDGKIHINDVDQVLKLVDGRKVRHVEKWVQNKLSEAGPIKIIKDKLPNASICKKATEMDFNIIENDYIQWCPDYIHNLSRIITNATLENISYSFDNEVLQILKKNDVFELTTQLGDFKCKKIIIAVGRSGWRWAHDTYRSFDLVSEDDYAYLGIKAECSAQYIKELNHSHCSLKRENLDIGPFNWDGAVIPEDHADVVISAFRSNEDRWKRLGKNKIVFDIISKQYFKDKGIKEMERLAKLAFVQFNDRVGREKIKSILKKESALSQIPEYDFLINIINEVNSIFPNLIEKGYFYAPTIKPQTAPIIINSNLETEVDGLFVAGESAGLFGINAAAISGVIAIDSALR
jgi:uncharacterized FAD-dependent dehydrogenase